MLGRDPVFLAPQNNRMITLFKVDYVGASRGNHPNAGRVLVMDYVRIVKEGRDVDLSAANNHYARMLD